MTRQLLVQDIMTREPLTAEPDLPLLDAYNRMTENEVRRLPVVESGELLGMVTLSDLLAAVPTLFSDDDAATKLLLSTRRVRDVMSWSPVTIDPEDTIQDAAERMLDDQVSGLPVISGNRVVGIITESDIFRLVVESWAEE
ncbi:MAG: CBS domain-containing protein [Caldilineaceae bacterium]|nr:CBS domain-containing protein [Caldilineaceae bacterium]MCB9136830.1 CBS domain-containing protein [Caldilineaceae bacterium]